MRRPLLLLLGVVLAASSCAPRSVLLQGAVVDDLRAGLAADGPAHFDHGPFDRLLRAHVRVADGQVDYGVLVAARGDLDRYLEALANAPLRQLGRDEQVALLSNAYNAFTLALVLERYPDLRSIRDLHDPWGQRRWRLGGHTVSLDDLEHGLLRPLYRDPRIHFVINCASVSCPPLRARALEAATLEAQLVEAVSDTLGRPGYARRDGDELALTSILRWFGDDFTDPDAHGHEATVQAWVARHGPPELAAFIAAADPVIRWLPYDWSLNDVGPDAHAGP